MFGNIKILTALNTGDILDVVPLHHHHHVPVGLVGVRGEIEGSRVRPGHQTFVSRLGGPRLTGTLRAVVVPESFMYFMRSSFAV